MTNFSVSIRVLGPHAGNCVMPQSPCSRPAFYAVTCTDDSSGSTSGVNVCGDHLFTAIRYFLGLPSGEG